MYVMFEKKETGTERHHKKALPAITSCKGIPPDTEKIWYLKRKRDRFLIHLLIQLLHSLNIEVNTKTSLCLFRGLQSTLL